MTVRILSLVACAKTKKPSACEARHLYSPSVLFRLAFQLSERCANAVLILSALHGIVRPTQIIEPYEQLLVGRSLRERQKWAEDAFNSLKEMKEYHDSEVVLFFAGQAYRDQLLRMISGDGKRCLIPMAGLALGQQVAWLNRNKAITVEELLKC